MEKINCIKAEWSWGTKWYLYTKNSTIQLEHYTEKGKDEWFLVGLWVNESCRRRGLSKNLIKRCLKIVPKDVQVKLYVEKDAPQWLLDYYKRNNFKTLKY